ncbi:MAG: ROK family protein [Candidatus Woesearchaeota archaeon]
MEIGIDCGGTKTEAIVVDGDTVIDHKFVLKPATKQTVFSVVHSLLKKYPEVTFIGIGFPAPIDNGKVHFAPNIPGWDNVDIAHEVMSKFGIPCKVENDANCFALGEAYENNLLDKTVVGITLGTGLGCGIVIHGKLHTGSTGIGGEIGHIPFEKATLEDATSKKFFLGNYKIEPKDAMQKALLKDVKYTRIVKQYGKNLGKMLATVVQTLDPEYVIFGGNISRSFGLFEEEMMKTAQKYIYPHTLKKLNVRSSSIPHAACRGAVLLKNL